MQEQEELQTYAVEGDHGVMTADGLPIRLW